MYDDIVHIPRSWAGHYAYRLFGIAPRALCGVKIRNWSEPDAPYCEDCVTAFPDPENLGIDARTWPLYHPDDCDPALLMHSLPFRWRHLERVWSRAYCGFNIHSGSVEEQIGQCSVCAEAIGEDVE